MRKRRGRERQFFLRRVITERSTFTVLWCTNTAALIHGESYTVISLPLFKLQNTSAMASTSLASTLTSSSLCPKKLFFNPTSLSSSISPSTISIYRTLRTKTDQQRRPNHSNVFSIKALTLDFSGSFFEGGMGEDDDPPSSPGSSIALAEEKEEPQCPPGLRQYETMVVLRPDMSEDERLALTQKYEELIIAGGGMYVEIFNRGVIPLAYSIKKKNKAGESNTYLDGIYLLFTYFTNPDSMALVETRLKADDNVIRSSSFKIRKRKY